LLRKNCTSSKLKKFKLINITDKFTKNINPPILDIFFLCNFLKPSGLSYNAMTFEKFLKNNKKEKFNAITNKKKLIIFFFY